LLFYIILFNFNLNFYHYKMMKFQKFEEMGLSENVLRGIFSYGFETPSSIQQEGIVPITLGKDVLAQAQSGTGKTGTFAIGMLQRIDTTINACQALLLAPTRELVDQIHKVALALGDYLPIRIICCMGGRPIRDDIVHIKQGCHVIVGTPGRVIDLIQRDVLSLQELKTLVVDEADEMFSIGFKDQMYDIFRIIPQQTQICLFSATMSNDVVSLSETFMRNPTHIRINREEITLEGIRQYYVNVEKEEYKFSTLLDLYEQLTITQAIIYCNSQQMVEWLSTQMNNNDFSVSMFHGGMSQQERDTVMKQFRLGKTRVLISTDVLSRGIDIQQVSMVFNYELPYKKENYIHRIGRSGRFGRKGIAINFITNESMNVLQHIQRFYETDIIELPTDVAHL
jgi:translation initiation factor 4A